MAREGAYEGTGSATYWSCAEALLLASQLSTTRLPSSEELRRRLLSVLERMVASGRSAGISDGDIAEARYAIVAFIDEQILKSDWAGRSEWMNQPLQLLLYKEYTAGENFYSRMRALLQAKNRPQALEAYYLCLALGFRGASGSRGETGGSREIAEDARERLAAVFPTPVTVSPNARLRDRGSVEKHSRLPIIAWVFLCVVVAIATWAGLGWSIARSVASTVDLVPARAGSVH